jgi:hypothetical protein
MVSSADDLLFDTDIPWRLRPTPPDVTPPLDPSTPDGLGLVYADVIALETHLASVQADLVTYRELVQISLERIAALTTTLRIRDATIRRFMGVIDDRADDDDGAGVST